MFEWVRRENMKVARVGSAVEKRERVLRSALSYLSELCLEYHLISNILCQLELLSTEQSSELNRVAYECLMPFAS